MRIRNDWSTQLFLVFGGIVATIVAAMLIAQWQLAAVGRASLEIADDSAPSIEHLTAARSEMHHVQIVLREMVEDQRAGVTTPRVADVEDARRAMDDALADYLILPATPEEQRLRGRILHAKDALNVAIERSVSKAEQRDFGATEGLVRQASAAADDLGAAITQTISLNASHSQDLALEISQLHRRSNYLAALLAVLCASITTAGAVVLRRALRRHQQLEDAHSALLQDRAEELEQFAGRVAHDVLSPLNVVFIALRRATSPDVDDAKRAQLADRGAAAIKRIDRLVKGLFAFAVAGAKPEAGARANVEATIGDLGPDLRAAAAEAGVRLEVAADVTSDVACNPGVLTSVVSNLGYNAIKYIGDGPNKRIDIRAIETRSSIRIEVQDTGPGLPPGLEASVFEPYVRGPGASARSGIGLGLATVKRVAIAHGGRVGVDSLPGAGCTFWVELPKAPRAAAPARPSIPRAAVAHAGTP